MNLSDNKAIGGYFELELNKGKEYHEKALALNTGRNCLEYILRVREYKKVFIPYYTCDVILEPFEKTGTNYEFYNIDKNLEPVNLRIGKNDALLYTNYFGIKSAKVKKLSSEYKNLIIDNSQAFFDKPLKGVDTFYSPRKFFGVPDGGYLYINKKLNILLKNDLSINRITHLVKRIEFSPETGYLDFLKSENNLKNNKIKLMSNFTKALLRNINYKDILKIRIRNFRFIHSQIGKYNKLIINKSPTSPFVYPFLNFDNNIRDLLIRNKIYVAKYWNKNISQKTNYAEKIFSKFLVPIFIDQRYSTNTLRNIVKIILDEIKG